MAAAAAAVGFFRGGRAEADAANEPTGFLAAVAPGPVLWVWAADTGLVVVVVLAGTRGLVAVVETGCLVGAIREDGAVLLVVRALLLVARVSLLSSPGLPVSTLGATFEAAVTRLLKGAVPGRVLGAVGFAAPVFSVSSGLSGFLAAEVVLVLVAVLEATWVLPVIPLIGLLGAGRALPATVEAALLSFCICKTEINYE